MISLNKYEELLDDFMNLMDEIDDEILLRGYDLTKLHKSIKKATNEA